MRGEHYFTERPTSKERRRLIKAVLRNCELQFITSSGIFSPKRIDKGSALLIENMHIKDGDAVLDLGCGYGVIGIAAAKSAKVKVTMTEINKRAARLAEENIKINHVENVRVVQGSICEPIGDEKFDAILCNLPMSAGLKLVYEIIQQAKEHLNQGGSLQVVVRKGAKRIEQKMQEVFGNVATLAKSRGYRVFISRR